MTDTNKIPVRPVEDSALLKQVMELRKDIDGAFVKVDRLLQVAQDKEEDFDFPVAFITNMMYVCAKNGNADLIDFAKYKQLLAKKMSFIHFEGISHASYALNAQGIHDPEIWGGLQDQLMKRDSYLTEHVAPDNWDPTSFELLGRKAGFAQRGVAHYAEGNLSESVNDLIFKD